MDHKYITCTGYGGTGSSVISDLMKEFKNVKSCGDYEFSLAFDVDGISDLQHFIVDDFERSKVVEGISRFERYAKIVKRRYNKTINSNVGTYFDDYIKDIVDFSWMGSNHLQVYRKSFLGRLWYYKYYQTKSKIKGLFHYNDGYRRGVEYPRVRLEVSYGKEKFFDATKNLYRKILDSFDLNNEYEYLHFDQLVPNYHFSRYSKYFPNIKIISVDRDPRDLYLLNKIYWHEGWIPTDSVDLYIKWFKIIREEFQDDLAEADNVLSIKFEDCIYKYDETISNICQFLGLDEKDHVLKQKHFNPNYSIRNTRIWEKHPEYQEDIRLISSNLSSYCYSY